LQPDDDVVTVACVAPPTIAWKCPRCPSRSFVCSERFRMNTHGRLADVWLIYRCARCDATKNVALAERTPVGRLPRRLHEAATTNDRDEARRYARDRSVLRRAGAQVDAGDAFAVERVVGPEAGQVRLALGEGLLVALVDVIAAATGVTRAQLRALERSGALEIDPPGPLCRVRLIAGVVTCRWPART